jgi:glycoprotein-N-acetylgalactosamine 3-beta-galactosyltransferase
VTDPKWNAVQMTSQPTYENLWNKLNETLLYISNTTHHFQDYDWYFKVDDDSFVVLENLQAFLASDPVQEKVQQQLPLIYGRNFAYPEYRTLRSMDTFFGNNSFVNRDFKRRFFQKFNGSERLVYPSGGAGYVMNPTFARKFVETLDGPDTLRGIPDEDMAVGVNMLYQGVRPEPSRDEHGLQLFHPELPSVMYNLPNGTADWLVDNHKTIGGIQPGKNCCSPYSISFHHARTPMIMRHMQYQIYHCRNQRKRKANKANHESLLRS